MGPQIQTHKSHKSMNEFLDFPSSPELGKVKVSSYLPVPAEHQTVSQESWLWEELLPPLASAGVPGHQGLIN